MVVAKDKSRALITYIKVMAQPNKRSTLIKPMGLDPNASYRILCDKKVLSMEGDVLQGDTIMNCGLLIKDNNSPDMWGDFRGVLIELSKV